MIELCCSRVRITRTSVGEIVYESLFVLEIVNSTSVAQKTKMIRNSFVNLRSFLRRHTGLHSNLSEMTSRLNSKRIMTSMNESNKFFFNILCHHNNWRNRYLWLFYLSVTPRNKTITIMRSAFGEDRPSYYSEADAFKTHSI